MDTYRSRYPGLLRLMLCACLFFICSSCGYKMIGSSFLPFDSISIKPVKNETYEPRLEERLHNALASEFISQGVQVVGTGGGAELRARVTQFSLGAVGAVDEIVKEQSLRMLVDVTIVTDVDEVTYKSVQSPIYISFASAGTVSDSVANKERAIEKASTEIAKEIVSRIITRYAK